MIFGLDDHFDDDNGRADTMMLISIDKKHNALKQVSFLRDLYLPIFNQGEDKLNAAFAYGGAKLAIETIEYNFKIKIDNYIVLDFDSFIYIINSLGGLDITLTEEEINYIDWQSFRNHQVEVEDELMSTAPDFEGQTGVKVHVNGRQALWHARNRGQEGICDGDDYTRTLRQRKVMSILIDRLKKSDFATIMSVIYDIGPMITTNLKTSEITKLATNITTYLKYDIVSASAPDYSHFGIDFYYDNLWINGYGLECIVIYDWNSFRKRVADFVFEDVTL